MFQTKQTKNKQTNRQTNKQTDKQTNKQVKQTNIEYLSENGVLGKTTVHIPIWEKAKPN